MTVSSGFAGGFSSSFLSSSSSFLSSSSFFLSSSSFLSASTGVVPEGVETSGFVAGGVVCEPSGFGVVTFALAFEISFIFTVPVPRKLSIICDPFLRKSSSTFARGISILLSLSSLVALIIFDFSSSPTLYVIFNSIEGYSSLSSLNLKPLISTPSRTMNSYPSKSPAAKETGIDAMPSLSQPFPATTT